MNLIQLRTQALSYGFDSNVYGSRVNGFLNDGYMLICRRVDYYVDSATSDFTTASGTAAYPWPADFARLRSLHYTDRNRQLQPVTLTQIDRSSFSNGTPQFYALDGANVHLWPTPDGAYPLEMRYWKLPALLVNDTDTPTLPPDYHQMLWTYAVAQCYWAEDDAQMGQAWDQKFTQALSMFSADQKFPSTDGPTQARSMWDDDTMLGIGWYGS